MSDEIVVSLTAEEAERLLRDELIRSLASCPKPYTREQIRERFEASLNSMVKTGKIVSGKVVRQSKTNPYEFDLEIQSQPAPVYLDLLNVKVEV